MGGRRTALSAVNHTSEAETSIGDEAKAGLDVPLRRGEALTESASGNRVAVASGVCEVEKEKRVSKRREEKEEERTHRSTRSC
jgi:hypothetical protein